MSQHYLGYDLKTVPFDKGLSKQTIGISVRASLP